MDIPVLASTVLLTLLLAVGLFFFIRASVKDRTEVVKLIAEGEQTSFLETLQQYFTERAYQIATVDAATNQVIYEGTVRPSWFLAIFLSALAGVGLLCLTLVLAILFPSARLVLPGLTLLAPVAGVFYWKQAGRRERVALQVEAVQTDASSLVNVLTVKAHRDELIQLQRSLNLSPYPEPPQA
ncbi:MULTISPECIES: cofactor assembly of complex C subunit B [unclassified Leptolyngbya]|uniref:cofactor assembly of complex C subunit B n=1 Tax=unclassified Leptolyngbya TaxID=2650499 RepID=UPI00168713DA|nr:MULTISPECIES: cofactor assembly of complex C subunit B [unclassified Leptolyngbya]MBD1912612.1 cofactor assembly of complex C subunit B [Leptolyngbya sp. FACHB-8]MBD2156781.1 cofactor assembly of complex C subunit B [Leptolyngbya sp. FACHB-16]